MKELVKLVSILLVGVGLILFSGINLNQSKDYQIVITDKMEIGCNSGRYSCYSKLVLIGTVKDYNKRISLDVTPVAYVDAVIGKEYTYHLRVNRVEKTIPREDEIFLVTVVVGSLLIAYAGSILLGRFIDE